MNKYRGPHKKLCAALVEGPVSRHELRMRFAYEYSKGVFNRTLNAIINSSLAVESDGLIMLNQDIVK